MLRATSWASNMRQVLMNSLHRPGTRLWASLSSNVPESNVPYKYVFKHFVCKMGIQIFKLIYK